MTAGVSWCFGPMEDPRSLLALLAYSQQQFWILPSVYQYKVTKTFTAELTTLIKM